MISIFSPLLSWLIASWAFISGVSAAPSGIWVIDIHNEPSPPPQDGPPEAFNAIRDPAYLPIQIGSIVGAYLLWVILIGIAIITVGRRLRRSAQTSPRSLGMEILSPSAKQTQHEHLPKAFDPSPISQVNANPWDPSPVSPTKKNNPWSPKLGGWGSFKKHKRQDSMQSSVVTFDESVISDDRMKNEIEMDRLYAAVAEHEAETTQGKEEYSPTSPRLQNPPELQHLRYATRQPEYPLSPPPEKDFERSPTFSNAPSRESTGTPGRRLNKKPPPLSFNNPPSRNSSHSSFTSFRSFGKKRGTSIRELPISPPMGSPDMAPDGTYSEAEPLTPRHYRPGPPPTPPMQSGTITSPQAIDPSDRRYHFSPSIRSSRSSVATGGFSPTQTPRTATFPIAPPPAIAEEQNHAGIAITIDTATTSRPPATAIGLGPSTTPPREKGEKSQRVKPAPLTLSNSANNSQSTLPMRTAPLPLRALRSPNSTRPMSQIRTQEVTRPDPGKLRAPGTAMPTTPYSPFYMPQTPLTPMTPSRLVTREERRRAKKEEGRRVLTEEDRVPEEAEIWGDGY
ncbi:hypothetical protein MMC10_011055 [Thelotrema lepadinum]|nr:hypothetical protein [Thelotrema lepadinum]